MFQLTQLEDLVGKTVKDARFLYNRNDLCLVFDDKTFVMLHIHNRFGEDPEFIVQADSPTAYELFHGGVIDYEEYLKRQAAEDTQRLDRIVERDQRTLRDLIKKYGIPEQEE